MRTVLFAIGLLTVAATASAQPSMTPSTDEPPPLSDGPTYAPPRYVPPPASYGGPSSYAPSAYRFTPREVIITEEERDILETGEISKGRHIAGGIVASAVGFGIGHTVEGRWRDTGWIFTVGESASYGLFIYGLMSGITANTHAQEDRAGTYIVGGMLAFAGLRVWEIVDAWAGPARHNRRLHQLQQRLGVPPGSPIQIGHIAPYVAPTHDAHGNGGVAGVALSF